MLNSILIAVGFFAFGAFSGICWTSALFLRKYKINPKGVIDLLEKYAKEYK